MAGDLAARRRTGVRVQLCGDAHLSNFGVFASPERRLVFDINDFDETLPGPWEWDVKRLAASVAIAGRDRGLRRRDRRARRARGRSRAYREAMREFAGDAATSRSGTRALDVGAIARQLARRAATSEAKALEKSVAKARTQGQPARARQADRPASTASCASSPTHRCSSRSRISLGGEAGEASRQDGASCRARYRRSLQRDRRRLLDGYRYVAPGPQGRRRRQRRHARLGRAAARGATTQDPLFLQVKEAQPSVLEPYAGRDRARQPRAARGGGAAADAGGERHLPRLVPRARGSTASERDFYVRQLWDWKALGRRRARCRLATLSTLRRAVRLDARARPRPLGRPRSRSRLPRQRRRLRPRARRRSPRPTPTRTSTTTRRSPRRLDPGSSHSRRKTMADLAVRYGEAVTWEPERPRIRPLRLLVSWAVSAASVVAAAWLLPGVERSTAGSGVPRRRGGRGAQRDPAAAARGAAAAVHGRARLHPRAVRRRAAAAARRRRAPGRHPRRRLRRRAARRAGDRGGQHRARRSSLGTNDDDEYTLRVTRRVARRQGGAERTDVPGILFLEIDGLALPVLRAAMRDGSAPDDGALDRRATATTCTEWETDLSSQTGASQAGILLGSNEDIPAFRWVEKETGRMMVCSSPADCAEIERAPRDRRRAAGRRRRQPRQPALGRGRRDDPHRQPHRRREAARTPATARSSPTASTSRARSCCSSGRSCSR